VYVTPFLTAFSVARRDNADLRPVYVEQTFARDNFEPDIFPTNVTEKEWKPNADRASIYKAALPEIPRDQPWNIA